MIDPDEALQDPPLGLAMALGRSVAMASARGIDPDELCLVVVDVAIAACRASGKSRQESLALFTERAARPIQEVSPR